VDEAGAVLGADKVAQQHRVAERAEVLALDVVERRLVADALERGAGEVGQHLGAIAERALDQRAGHDHHLVTSPRAHVLDLRSGGDRRMADQRPRRGGPDEQRIAHLDLI
jgi:hypothetical protein